MFSRYHAWNRTLTLERLQISAGYKAVVEKINSEKVLDYNWRLSVLPRVIVPEKSYLIVDEFRKMWSTEFLPREKSSLRSRH